MARVFERLLVGVAVCYASFYASQGRERVFETGQEDSCKAETAQEETVSTTPVSETNGNHPHDRLRQ
ncbi:MAG: hypothetical protein AVDCRST_MAG14-912 [uncultured Rubrobacteraceae bacterium]|uniref:Uncharacterized protein n=1 Tax=uncultured Rubrobacteraceae bacterium TaxID=349277 RepID=A0A6J4QPF1_9ACTN|nr:MAG: hypothetical protein AVDCRST_MAG14-912 [uncultured Rubrobacteraceae bacterium]